MQLMVVKFKFKLKIITDDERLQLQPEKATQKSCKKEKSHTKTSYIVFYTLTLKI